MNFSWLGQAPRRALLVGDSLAVGLGSPLAAELSAQSIALTTRAEVGTNADQWRSRAPALLDSLRPAIVLISLGSNDAQSSSLTASFPANLRAICDAARASGASRCALLVAPNRTASMVDAGGVERISAPGPVELQSDGIHPTAAGYRAWAAQVARQVAAPSVAVPAATRSPIGLWLAAAAAVAVGAFFLSRTVA